MLGYSMFWLVWPALLSALIGQSDHSGVAAVEVKYVKKMEIVQADGERSILQMAEEEYYRDAAGSVYQRTVFLDPATGEPLATLRSLESAKTGMTYLIDDAQKMMMIAPGPRGNHAGRPPRPRDGSVARRRMLGRTCVVLPFSGAGEGEVWIDESTDTLMMMRRETPIGAGAVRVKSMQAVEFRAGTSPDPQLFLVPELPPGYRLEERPLFR